MILSRSTILGTLLALAPTVTSAGGGTAPPAVNPFSCPQRTPYEVQLIAGSGPFGGSRPRRLTYLDYNYLNTGAAMPHLVVSVDSLGTFTAGTVRATLNTGRRRSTPPIRLIGQTGSVYVWDLGPFPAGAEEMIDIEAHLKRPCCFQAKLATFANLNQYGAPDPHSLVANGSSRQAGRSSTVPISPPPDRG